MVDRWNLPYLMLTLIVGVGGLGVALGLALRTTDRVSRALLAFYAALTMLVSASLMLAFADAVPGAVSPGVRSILVYLESFIGRYAVMLTLPLLAHRIFFVEGRGRDQAAVAVVTATFALQHVTEIVLGSTVWDERGDLAEDLVNATVVAYVLWLGVTRLRAPLVSRPLVVRFLALLGIGLPTIVNDIFLGDVTAFRLYPLVYGLLSVTVVWTAVRHRRKLGASPAMLAIEGPPFEADWDLSQREAEVARLVARGLSNKEVAAALHISQNTVKTHLRAIFDKADVRSRFELIARLGRGTSADHPEG